MDPLALSVNMFFTNANRFVVSDAPTGLFTVCSGRHDPGQIDIAKLSFGRAEFFGKGFDNLCYGASHQYGHLTPRKPMQKVNAYYH
jgi:hypothetical protein